MTGSPSLMVSLRRFIVYIAAALVHLLALHAFIVFHASTCNTLITLQWTTNHLGYLGRTVYYICFFQYDVFATRQIGYTIGTDTHARIAETCAIPIGRLGVSLPGDRLTIGVFLIFACTGYAAVYGLVYVRKYRSQVGPAIARVSHTTALVLAVLSCGVSLAIIFATDRATLWPTRMGPFLPPRNIAICVAVATVFYITAILCLERHALLLRAYRARTLCRCGHDLSGVAHIVCPECGKKVAAGGTRNRFAWRATAKYRLGLLMLALLCCATTGLLAWCFLPLRWQVQWRNKIDYMTVGNSYGFQFGGVTPRPADYPEDEWNAYADRVLVERRKAR